MTNKIVNLSVVCLGVALSSTSFASELLYSPTRDANPFYVGVFGGVVKMMDGKDTVTIAGVDVDFTKTNKTGYDAGLAAGYRFLCNFRAEIALSHILANADTLKGDGVKLSASGETQVTPLMLNGYYDITQLSNVIVPYVGAGLGGAYVDENIKTAGVQDWKGNDTVFAYQGIVGVGFRITPQLTASVDYRYLATEEASFDVSGSGGLATANDNIANHIVNAGLTYYFG